MLQEERYQAIVNAVNERGFVSADELIDLIGVSRSTMRRDLEELNDMRLLLRTRGGAISLKNGTSHEPPLEQRKDRQFEEKKKIAEVALSLIHERDTILIDSGTTSIELARLLGKFKQLMVATYDLNIANVLSDMQSISLVVAGGNQRKHFNTLVGYFSEMIFSQIHADMLFLTVDAVDLDHGCMNYNIEEISVKKAMIKAAKKVVVLCDHTKFDTIAFINTCPLSDVDIIVTDSVTSCDVIDKLKEKGIEVLLA